MIPRGLTNGGVFHAAALSSLSAPRATTLMAAAKSDLSAFPKMELNRSCDG